MLEEVHHYSIPHSRSRYANILYPCEVASIGLSASLQRSSGKHSTFSLRPFVKRSNPTQIAPCRISPYPLDGVETLSHVPSVCKAHEPERERLCDLCLSALLAVFQVWSRWIPTLQGNPKVFFYLNQCGTSGLQPNQPSILNCPAGSVDAFLNLAGVLAVAPVMFSRKTVSQQMKRNSLSGLIFFYRAQTNSYSCGCQSPNLLKE